VRVKAERGARSTAAPADAEAAIASLIGGEVVAVQLRYHDGEAAWSDTAMRRGDSFRLVRLRAD
jgi:hypothetical protein